MRNRGGQIRVAAVLGVLLCLGGASAAGAATYNVNTTADLAAPGCAGGTCSLRQAVEAVSTGVGTGDTINLPAGHYVLTMGPLDILKPAALAGAGARSTIIDAGFTSGLLSFLPGASPSALSGLTLTQGSVAGLDNQVSLTVSEVTIGSNRSAASGGGVKNQAAGTLTIERSTISGNEAALKGGGIYNEGTLSVTNSTVSGNKANTGGGLNEAGGIYSTGSASVADSTIAGNSANAGGGVDNAGGTFSFFNTIVADNTTTSPVSPNCVAGPYTSLGNNLESANSCSFNQASDLPNTPSNLGPLQDNGGPTNTQALLANSAAINKANNTGCPAADQRGITRPQDGVCDIGAYEFAPPVVKTDGSGGRNTAGATIVGSINPNQRFAAYSFEYGRTTQYGKQTSLRGAGAGNKAVTVSTALTGLVPGRKYHYRLVANNPDGTRTGDDRTFKTVKFPGVTLRLRDLRLNRKGRVPLRLRCPKHTAGGSCAVRLALYLRKGQLPRTAGPAARKRARLRRAARLSARPRYKVKSGKTQKKRLRLRRRGRRALRHRSSYRVRLLITARDGSGNQKTRTYRVRLLRRR